MRINKYSLLCSAFFMLMVVSLPACKVSEEEGYGRWDADANTMIDRNEYTTAWNEAGYYGRWDANRDNFLDESEWNAGQNTYMQDMGADQVGAFTDWDADGDGRLTDTEFRDRTFDVFDADRDGNLNEAEYNTWWGGFNRTGI
jgi:Ca2+-binding EF-hand superfamily protein